MVNVRNSIKNIFIIYGEFLQWESQWYLKAFNSLEVLKLNANFVQVPLTNFLWNFFRYICLIAEFLLVTVTEGYASTLDKKTDLDIYPVVWRKYLIQGSEVKMGRLETMER